MNEQVLEKLVAAAKAEALAPSMPLSQQLLSTCTVAKDETGLPIVVHVHADVQSEDPICVFFEVQDEDYFFVVHVNRQDGQPSFARLENGHRFEFCVTSVEHSFDELRSKTTLQNLEGWSKGELLQTETWEIDGVRMRSEERIRNFSLLHYVPTQNPWDDFEESLSQMLSDLEQDVDGVIELSKCGDAKIKVIRFQAVMANAGYIISPHSIFRLNRLGLWLDIHQSISGEWSDA